MQGEGTSVSRDCALYYQNHVTRRNWKRLSGSGLSVREPCRGIGGKAVLL